MELSFNEIATRKKLVYEPFKELKKRMNTFSQMKGIQKGFSLSSLWVIKQSTHNTLINSYVIQFGQFSRFEYQKLRKRVIVCFNSCFFSMPGHFILNSAKGNQLKGPIHLQVKKRLETTEIRRTWHMTSS